MLLLIHSKTSFLTRNKYILEKCSSCGKWNRVSVNKIFIEPSNPIEPKVKVIIPMYEPLQISKCEKCGKVIAEPTELIRIVAVKE